MTQTAWEDINQDAGDRVRGRPKLLAEEEEWEDVENVTMGYLEPEAETQDPEVVSTKGLATAEHATEATAFEENTTETVATETAAEATAPEAGASAQEEAPVVKDLVDDELEVAI